VIIVEAGNKVIVTNRDSSFYGEKGRIIGINGSFFSVFLKNKKDVYNFTRYDLSLEEESEE
jgi:hypothetical protein